jgi:hypothetical protein
MRKSARISSTRRAILLVSSVGPRRYFPAWIDSDDRLPSPVVVGAVSVLPRVRASLPLRRVTTAAVEFDSTSNRRLSDARRLR